MLSNSDTSPGAGGNPLLLQHSYRPMQESIRRVPLTQEILKMKFPKRESSVLELVRNAKNCSSDGGRHSSRHSTALLVPGFLR
jgi:hypothetical protein